MSTQGGRNRPGPTSKTSTPTARDSTGPSPVPPPGRDDFATETTGIASSIRPEPKRAPTFRLVCVAGADLGQTFHLASLPTTIGRAGTDITLKSKDVSRNHVRIGTHGAGFVVEDLGSANGTFLNGNAVDGRATLRVGDRIQLGTTILLFTQYDELEARVHQLKRLEAMGALAGGLAHDFNNALTVILANLDLFDTQLPPTSPLRDAIDDMRMAASSASSLAARLLRLGRSEGAEFANVQMAPLVQRTATMLRGQLGTRIQISIEVPAELVVRGATDELHQVLINLLLNARDAMPHGGKLALKACAATFDAREAATRHLPTKGEYVELAISDTGTGMDDATLARMFEPFFTTKPPGQGTGLGLAMIYSVVRRHGGAISVDSRPGKGTTFTIWLPRVSA